MRPFRFGIQCAPRQPEGPGALVDVVRRVEALGYSTFTVADHLGDDLAITAALATAAAATTCLRIGTLVACNDFRHPVLLAKEAATIDVLSNGRFEFGMGAGWFGDEYRQAGIPFASAGERIDRLAEAIDIVEGMWTGEPFTFRGRHYEVAGLPGNPRPRQLPGPPLLIGGGGRGILTLAGRRADIVGLNVDLRAGTLSSNVGTSATEAATTEKLEWIREGASGRSYEPELHVRVQHCQVTDDRDGVLPKLATRLGVTPEQASRSPHVLCGTVEEIVDEIVRRREQFGISYLSLNQRWMDAMAPVVKALAGQ